jgi:hypothetical protein
MQLSEFTLHGLMLSRDLENFVCRSTALCVGRYAACSRGCVSLLLDVGLGFPRHGWACVVVVVFAGLARLRKVGCLNRRRFVCFVSGIKEEGWFLPRTTLLFRALFFLMGRCSWLAAATGVSRVRWRADGNRRSSLVLG